MTVPITFSLALPKLARDAGVPELRQGVRRRSRRARRAGARPPWRSCSSPTAASPSGVPWRGATSPGRARCSLRSRPGASAPCRTTPSSRSGSRPSSSPARSEPASVSLKATGLQAGDLRPPRRPPASHGPRPLGRQSQARRHGRSTHRQRRRRAPSGSPQRATCERSHRASAVRSAHASRARCPWRALPQPPPDASAARGDHGARSRRRRPRTASPRCATSRSSRACPTWRADAVPCRRRVARMAGATGTVEVAFSVSAAGATTIQNVTGPDLLKKAAEQAVASWVFRRTRADRAYLVAVFSYGRGQGDRRRSGRSRAPASRAPAATTAARSGRRARPRRRAGARLRAGHAATAAAVATGRTAPEARGRPRGRPLVDVATCDQAPTRPRPLPSSRPSWRASSVGRLLGRPASSRPPSASFAVLLVRLVVLLRGLLVLGRGLVLVADELEVGHLRAVAVARAEAQDARVAARARREARAERVEQLLDDGRRPGCRAPRAAARAARFSSLRASVISFSAKERTSFAFGSVVRIRSLSKSAVAGCAGARSGGA